MSRADTAPSGFSVIEGATAMVDVEKIEAGTCRAHNPNKESYEVFCIDGGAGYWVETDRGIAGPYITTEIYPTREEAIANYELQAKTSRSWESGKWVGDPDDPDDQERLRLRAAPGLIRILVRMGTLLARAWKLPWLRSRTPDQVRF
jgi:hypothetical protein